MVMVFQKYPHTVIFYSDEQHREICTCAVHMHLATTGSVKSQRERWIVLPLDCCTAKCQLVSIHKYFMIVVVYEPFRFRCYVTQSEIFLFF